MRARPPPSAMCRRTWDVYAITLMVLTVLQAALATAVVWAPGPCSGEARYATTFCLAIVILAYLTMLKTPAEFVRTGCNALPEFRNSDLGLWARTQMVNLYVIRAMLALFCGVYKVVYPPTARNTVGGLLIALVVVESMTLCYTTTCCCTPPPPPPPSLSPSSTPPPSPHEHALAIVHEHGPGGETEDDEEAPPPPPLSPTSRRRPSIEPGEVPYGHGRGELAPLDVGAVECDEHSPPLPPSPRATSAPTPRTRAGTVIRPPPPAPAPGSRRRSFS